MTDWIMHIEWSNTARACVKTLDRNDVWEDDFDLEGSFLRMKGWTAFGDRAGSGSYLNTEA